MKKWEYTVEYMRSGTSMTDALKVADEFGDKGWEVIRITGDSVRGLEIIFKREKQADPDTFNTPDKPFAMRRTKDGRK